MATDKADHLMLKPSVRKSADRTKQYLATIAISLGGVCSGTVFSWSSPVLAQLDGANSTLHLTLQEKSLVGSFITFGGLLSTLPMGYLVDKFGRKPVILSSSLTFLLSWALIITAKSPLMLIIGRFFAGFAIGTNQITGPMYLGEIAEPKIRGMLISIYQLNLAIGVLLTNLIGFFTDWVTLSIILATFPIIFTICFCFMPESPIFLLKQGRKDASREVLRSFRGKHYDVDTELMEIKEKLDEAAQKKAGIKEIFRSITNRRAMTAALGILFFQQFCGISAIIFYTVSIFQATGSNLNPHLAAVLITMFKALTSFIFVYLIEKARRKFYLAISSIGMLICLLALGAFFHFQQLGIEIKFLNYLPIASIVLYVIFFSIGYGPMIWVFIGELFAPEIKGLASGIASMIMWCMNFAIAYSFPIMKESFGDHVPFYFFAFWMIVATIFTHFLVPETRGKSLPQIQEDLERNHYH